MKQSPKAANSPNRRAVRAAPSRAGLGFACSLAWSLGAAGCGPNANINAGGSHSSSAAPPASPSGGSPAPASGDGRAAGTPIDVVVTPPHEYYDALFSKTVAGLDQQTLAGAAAAAQVLWVNFDGASLTKGFGAGESFVLCNATAVIPASDLSPADRDTVVQTVQQYYDAAGAKLAVTSAKPASGDFTTINVGGSYTDLGCAGAGVAGVAPFDPGNADPNDIGFAFTDQISAAKDVAAVVAHEAGHTFGLQHVDTAADLMYPSLSPAVTGFGSGNIVGTSQVQNDPAVLQQALGLTSATAGTPATPAPAPAPAAAGGVPGLANLPAGLAGLPGLGQLAGLAQLLPSLAGGNVLDISKLLPALTSLASLTGGAGNLQGLDQILTAIGLASAAGGSTTAGVPGLGNLSGLGGLVSGLLNAKGGASPVNLANLLQLGGFANLPGALQSLSGLFGGVLGGGAAAPAAGAAPAQLPNLASLLNLGGGSNATVAALLKNLTGSAGVVNGNFSGASSQALLSLLKVAYAQQYTQLLGNLP